MRLRVAPREITDYVERAARVGGCDPSDARLLACAATFAEVHGGGGVAAFVAAPDTTALASAVRSLDDAMMTLLDDVGSEAVEHVFEGRVASELLAMSAEHWRRDGVTADLAATGRVDRVMVRRVDGVERDDARRREYRRALAEGVEVDRRDWERLTTTATAFLVAESVLDAHDE